MKKYIIVFISILLILFNIFTSSAASYSAYSNVTDSTSQINILFQALFNRNDFEPFKPFVALRTGDVDYSIFYNIKDGNAKRLRYYGTSSGYNTIWHLQFSEDNNFTYFDNGYTVVGNSEGQLGSSAYREYKHKFIWMSTVPFILILFIFFVFRIKRRNKGGITL